MRSVCVLSSLGLAVRMRAYMHLVWYALRTQSKACVCVCVNPGKLARNVCRIDLLAPEAFAEGFGLQTPMVTGQMNVVRYYPYFTRALEVVKKLVADSGTVFCSDDGSGGLCCLAV